jgi:hypothetical protein
MGAGFPALIFNQVSRGFDSRPRPQDCGVERNVVRGLILDQVLVGSNPTYATNTL